MHTLMNVTATKRTGASIKRIRPAVEKLYRRARLPARLFLVSGPSREGRPFCYVAVHNAQRAGALQKKWEHASKRGGRFKPVALMDVTQAPAVVSPTGTCFTPRQARQIPGAPVWCLEVACAAKDLNTADTLAAGGLLSFEHPPTLRTLSGPLANPLFQTAQICAQSIQWLNPCAVLRWSRLRSGTPAVALRGRVCSQSSTTLNVHLDISFSISVWHSRLLQPIAAHRTAVREGM